MIALGGMAAAARAGDLDVLHAGSFRGVWCGYDATFDLTSRNKHTGWLTAWDGKILIIQTGQYDQLFIGQNYDKSLRIVRYLTGSLAGSTQNVATFPPEIVRASDGETIAKFKGAAGGGPGCKNVPVLLILKQ